jgi:flagellar protein FlhE
MRILSAIALLCWLIPPWADAQTYVRATYEISGSRYAWTGSALGPLIASRGQRAVSSPVLPAGTMPQASGIVTSVRWRYSFVGAPPIDLEAYLCNAQRCVLLSGAEGKTDAFAGDDATRGFVFAYRVPGRGGLSPSLQGRSNEVTVSYR